MYFCSCSHFWFGHCAPFFNYIKVQFSDGNARFWFFVRVHVQPHGCLSSSRVTTALLRWSHCKSSKSPWVLRTKTMESSSIFVIFTNFNHMAILTSCQSPSSNFDLQCSLQRQKLSHPSISMGFLVAPLTQPTGDRPAGSPNHPASGECL